MRNFSLLVFPFLFFPLLSLSRFLGGILKLMYIFSYTCALLVSKVPTDRQADDREARVRGEGAFGQKSLNVLLLIVMMGGGGRLLLRVYLIMKYQRHFVEDRNWLR